MNKQEGITNVKFDTGPRSGFLPVDVEGYDSLAELALDMRWSWNHYADEVWRQLDPALWELTHNPWDWARSTQTKRRKTGSENKNDSNERWMLSRLEITFPRPATSGRG